VDASLYSIYAQCLRASGDYDEAIKYFHISKDLFEKLNYFDEFGILHDVAFDAGNYFMNNKEDENAIEFFKLGLKGKENDEKCLNGLAIAYENILKFDESETLFLKLVELFPTNSNYFCDLALFYQFKKINFEKSKFYFSKGIELDDKNLLIKCYYATFLLDTGDLEKSKDLFEVVLKDVPNNWDVLKFLGIIHFKWNQLDLAKEKFTIANKFKANDPYLLGYLALIEHKKGNLKQSKNVYGHALSCVTEENFDHDLVFNFVELLIELKDFDEVDEAFNVVLDKFPNDSKLLKSYAKFLSEHRKEEFEKKKDLFKEIKE
jgi:tetratricopeptide (TPR) repeat protein